MANQPLDYEQCTPDEREVVLHHLLTARNALLDEAFRVILAADQLDDHRADGALTMTDWLTYRANVSRATAGAWVRAAAALAKASTTRSTGCYRPTPPPEPPGQPGRPPSRPLGHQRPIRRNFGPSARPR